MGASWCKRMEKDELLSSFPEQPLSQAACSSLSRICFSSISVPPALFIHRDGSWASVTLWSLYIVGKLAHWDTLSHQPPHTHGDFASGQLYWMKFHILVFSSSLWNLPCFWKLASWSLTSSVLQGTTFYYQVWASAQSWDLIPCHYHGDLLLYSAVNLMHVGN